MDIHVTYLDIQARQEVIPLLKGSRNTAVCSGFPHSPEACAKGITVLERRPDSPCDIHVTYPDIQAKQEVMALLEGSRNAAVLFG